MKKEFMSFWVLYVAIPFEDAVTYLKTIPTTVVVAFRDIFDKSPAWLWNKRLRLILTDVPKKSHPLYSAVLTNQFNEVSADAGHNYYTDFMDTILTSKVILDKLAPLFQIIGVQAMQGPVALSFYMQYTDKDVEKITLEVVKTTVEASTRKLITSVSAEAIADLKAIHGLDMAYELREAVADEIAIEITAEHLSYLSELANKITTKAKKADGIMTVISKASNDIAIATRRGPANKHIMSPSTFAKLLPVFKKGDYESFTETFGPGLTAVGKYHSVTIFVNLFMADDKILIGYKGNSDIDAGYFMNPYIMVIALGASMTEEFVPMYRLMTRRGKVVLDNGSDYYTEITLK